ncbi:AI-2E family transporter [Rhodoferax sp.]|uniref:AI-2E family transporter n=1 Tax=Rhodoferax sp. TaxID=50421 RepID=UPI0027183FD6|nr:AI-2E family transporter [Rhodoferax sp.]MDO8320465.1 AI-2E family transporter [Rhodoferax sp.]MDP2680813.1 AI-2E family transporter [Rhodoferax sp.]
MNVSAGQYRAGPVVWAANIAGTCLVLFLFQKILWLVVPFVLALVIYYALLPLKLRLVLAGVSHDGAAAWVSLGTSVLLVLVAMLVFPMIVAKAVTWETSTTRYLSGGIQMLAAIITQLEARFSILAQAHAGAAFAAQIAEFSSHFADKYLSVIAFTVAAWSPALLLAPFLAFFMLRDGWRFRKFLIRAVPNAYFERCLYLLNQVDRTARLYFVGLIKLTVLDTACLAAGLMLLGVSEAVLLGLLAAVLAWIPFVGSIVGCFLLVLIVATDFPGNPDMVYATVVLFLAVRLLDDFVFMPLTIGKSLNMHPLLTVLMIFVGGAVAGVPGLMLVLPVLGVIMVLGETVGLLVTDPRLRARHAHERALQQQLVTRDLRVN